MIVEFLKKTSNFIKNMFKEDHLAAAQIAQIFGSELLKVQQNAQTDSGTQPDIVKLDPKQFLMNAPQFQNARKAEERRLIEILQREAEATHPLPVDPQNAHPVSELNPPLYVAPPAVQHKSEAFVTKPHYTETSFVATPEVLERIARSLEKIANAFDRFDIKPKQKTIKRKLKSNKSILLNETNA